MTTLKKCQSCGMPFKKDPEGGGTNADGSKNGRYCSYCYQHGLFTQPSISAVEMQNFVQEKLREQGFPGFLARIFSKQIHTLERWQKQ